MTPGNSAWDLSALISSCLGTVSLASVPLTLGFCWDLGRAWNFLRRSRQPEQRLSYTKSSAALWRAVSGEDESLHCRTGWRDVTHMLLLRVRCSRWCQACSEAWNHLYSWHGLCAGLSVMWQMLMLLYWGASQSSCLLLPRVLLDMWLFLWNGNSVKVCTTLSSGPNSWQRLGGSCCRTVLCVTANEFSDTDSYLSYHQPIKVYTSPRNTRDIDSSLFCMGLLFLGTVYPFMMPLYMINFGKCREGKSF